MILIKWCEPIDGCKAVTFIHNDRFITRYSYSIRLAWWKDDLTHEYLDHKELQLEELAKECLFEYIKEHRHHSVQLLLL